MFSKLRLSVKWPLLLLALVATNCVGTAVSFAAAPSPEEALAALKEGNARFVAGQSAHPRADSSRIADTAQNGQHPFTTVLTCSDSRVPVEHVFDQGIGDVFVIRVAGNICDTDEIGSIEYGVDHLGTPLLVVLGHTKCGAVTAVTTNAALHGNIPPLVDNIRPAVVKAQAANPNLQGEALVPEAIKANCWQAIDDLFQSSPATRDKVKSGAVKVVAAVYDVANGRVEWLGAHPEQGRLLAYTGGPSSHGGESAVAAHGSEPSDSQKSSSHGSAAATSHQAKAGSEVSAADDAEVASILRSLSQQKNAADHRKEVTRAGLRNASYYGFVVAIALLALGLVCFYARTKDERGDTRMRWTLGSKLIGGFSLVIILLTCLAVYAMVAMGGIGRDVADLAEEINPLTDSVAQIEASQLEQSVALERALRYGQETGQRATELLGQQSEAFKKADEEIAKEFADAIKLLQDRPAVDEEDAKAMADAMNSLAGMEVRHKSFSTSAEKVIALLKEGKVAQAAALEKPVEEAESALDQEITQFLSVTQKRSEESGKTAEADEQRAVIILLSISVATIMLGFTIAVVLTRSIVRPVTRIISSLTEGSEQVASASGQVSAASQSLAEGATEQAAGLEETSSSLEEMSSMTKQNANNAQQANTLAAEAKKAANTGTESMGRMSQAIHDIQKSSDETAKIIKVIDEIAFQTNLLALNAAVEAARAGEAGKGFAVVAEEVRNLAMRSAEAAKNTARMIEESVKNSKNGVDIATEVGKVLQEIVQSVGKTTDLVSEIAAASQEQAQGIDQVNTAVAQMDKVTQQNAANAEESASASEELNAQAESMKEVVGQLTALVGGATTQQARSGGPKTTEHHLHVNLEHKAPKVEKAVAKAHAFGKSDEAFHKIARPQAKRTPVAKAVGKTIPLDKSEDDLSTFNN